MSLLGMHSRVSWQASKSAAVYQELVCRHGGLSEPDDAPPSGSEHLQALVHRIGGSVREQQLEIHDEDKAQIMTSSVLDLLIEACRDPEGKIDSEALQHLQAHARHCASDQCPAVQKSGKQLATCSELPNLVWLSYDPAHQIRIAFQDPLHAVTDFNEQWQQLFAGRHALIPDIKNSEIWKLLAAQRAVLDKHGSQSGLERTMRAFSFAQPRFDSTATPMMKYCLLARAIAILCAMQAVDVPCLQGALQSQY